MHFGRSERSGRVRPTAKGGKGFYFLLASLIILSVGAWFSVGLRGDGGNWIKVLASLTF